MVGRMWIAPIVLRVLIQFLLSEDNLGDHLDSFPVLFWVLILDLLSKDNLGGCSDRVSRPASGINLGLVVLGVIFTCFGKNKRNSDRIWLVLCRL